MPKISRKFLLVFSTCSLAVAGIVYACSDGDWYGHEASAFAPEAFVAPEYSPFFYTGSSTYYSNEGDNNTRFNDVVIAEWRDWFKNTIDTATLKSLVLKASFKGVDSARLFLNGKLAVSPAGMPGLSQFKSDKKKADLFFTYLLLAKAAESYATTPSDQYWYDPESDQRRVSVTVEEHLKKGFDLVKDPFIKQRLWFQLVRYYYYADRLEPERYQKLKYNLPAYFAATATAFPQNTIFYRALSYLAGYYYKRELYSEANYLYSKAYNHATGLKIPSQWSFHPQEEKDWNATLAMAKTTEEKVSLWHVLGTTQDELRGIKAIYALDPQSEKLDLLLSRLINKREENLPLAVQSNEELAVSVKAMALEELKVVNGIAASNKVHQPVLWKLGAGYLNALSGDYAAARKFYDSAKRLIPAGNTLMQAQYRLLDWSLYIKKLSKIDAKAEKQMAEHLNWLADLSQQKEVIADLRFGKALSETLNTLADLYTKQNELVKANCFRPGANFYLVDKRVEAMKDLMQKPDQTAFEKAMLRFYPVKLAELYYLQASQLVYKDQPAPAVKLMEQAAQSAELKLYGNPFNMRLVDCHDCDHQQVMKTPFTALSFVKTLAEIKMKVEQGEDIARNAALLANAYYNISYYGNARVFYQSGLTESHGNYPGGLSGEFGVIFTSNKLAEKYYLLAQKHTVSKELKAKYTFMASKCEHNTAYNAYYDDPSNAEKYFAYDELLNIPDGQYYMNLKDEYSGTAFYQDIIRECGYFRTYLKKAN